MKEKCSHFHCKYVAIKSRNLVSTLHAYNIIEIIYFVPLPFLSNVNQIFYNDSNNITNRYTALINTYANARIHTLKLSRNTFPLRRLLSRCRFVSQFLAVLRTIFFSSQRRLVSPRFCLIFSSHIFSKFTNKPKRIPQLMCPSRDNIKCC